MVNNFLTISAAKNRHGFSNLLIMIFFAFLATLVIAVIQSRLLLAIARNKSLSDILIAQYASESTINDILKRIISFGATSFPAEQTLADGTVIDLMITGTNPQTFTLTAKRPYAVSKIEAIKNTTLISGGFDNYEIVLALDCTSSMTDLSDESEPDRNKWISRMHAEKIAVLNLISFINALANKDKIKLGISVFRDNARWLQASAGNDSDLVLPTNDYSITPPGRLVGAINYAFPDDPDCVKADGTTDTGNTQPSLKCWDRILRDPAICYDSGCSIPSAYAKFEKFPACNNPLTLTGSKTIKSLNGNTSISSGVMFAEDNITRPRPANTKQAIILITDGGGAVAIVDVADPITNPFGCGNQYYCANYYGYCNNLPTPFSGYNTGEKSVGNCEKKSGLSPTGKDICNLATNICNIPEQPAPSPGKPCFADKSCYVYGESLRPINYGLSCSKTATSQLACAMADQTRTVSENSLSLSGKGRRDPEIDLYMLTVYSWIEPALENMYKKYIDTNYIKLSSANELTGKLNDIITIINSSSTSIQLRRVTP